jgi:hypothetical protein
MSDLWTFDELDRDGALEEAAAQVDADTRGAFLRKAGLGLGAMVGGGALLGALPSIAGAAVPSSDVAILNFALTLEYLEAAFYDVAVRNGVAKGGITGETAAFARTVAAHEKAHVAFLRKALGGKAVPEPKFNFRETTTDQAKFQKTAMVLEDAGVAAYLGQVGNIKAKPILAAAGSILPVEARHAAWIRDIASQTGNQGINPSPAPSAFQGAKTKKQILTAVKGTGFVV